MKIIQHHLLHQYYLLHLLHPLPLRHHLLLMRMALQYKDHHQHCLDQQCLNYKYLKRFLRRRHQTRLLEH
jgi:hypothetical protein